MAEVQVHSVVKRGARRGRGYWSRLAWLVAGPVAWLLMLGISPSGELTADGVKVAAAASWLVIWWIGSPVPIPVTSLLPLCLFPLTGVSTLAQAAGGYANRIIYLFLGGFMMALAIERHDLHRRLAWGVLLVLGNNSRRLLLGFMLAVGFLSMWLSNTATTVMMLPVAMAVIGQLPELLRVNMNAEDAEQTARRIGRALLLGIAFAASIGGMGTLIGTPPNAILSGIVREQFQVELSFVKWMIVGVPVSVVGLIASYWFLAIKHKVPSVHTPEVQRIIRQHLRDLGPFSANQIMVGSVFGLAALAWVTRPFLINPFLPKIDDAAIAMIGALLMFSIPQRSENRGELSFLIDWKDMLHLPWGVLLLFGGGFSLASAFSKSGLSQWIGSQLTLTQGLPLTGLLLVVIVLMSLLTQVTSNAASTTVMLPILGALGTAINVEPLLLMASATLSASCAFMLPVATPPNAIVFGSGRLTVRHMFASGAWINLGFVFLLTLAARFLVPILL